MKCDDVKKQSIHNIYRHKTARLKQNNFTAISTNNLIVQIYVVNFARVCVIRFECSSSKSFL